MVRGEKMKLTLVDVHGGHTFSAQNSLESVSDMRQKIELALTDPEGSLLMQSDTGNDVVIFHNSLFRQFIIRIEEA